MQLINAINAFFNKALAVNTTPSEALAPFLADDFISSASVESKEKEQLLGQLKIYSQF